MVFLENCIFDLRFDSNYIRKVDVEIRFQVYLDRRSSNQPFGTGVCSKQWKTRRFDSIASIWLEKFKRTKLSSLNFIVNLDEVEDDKQKGAKKKNGKASKKSDTSFQ